MAVTNLQPSRNSAAPTAAMAPRVSSAAIADIINSTSLWRARDETAAAVLVARHEQARKYCDASGAEKVASGYTTVSQPKQTQRTGGWCLGMMVSARLFGQERNVSVGASSYRLPAAHVSADLVLLDGMRNITDSCRLSVNDFGAGVGQYGHELQRDGCRWHGYDGAGDVEEYTNGFVRYVDLTMPLALPRTDWVVSLEVGEHVPRVHEMALIRNLHAHNRCGVLLSWACCHGGHQHVNLHSNRHIIDIFERLGYTYDIQRSEAMRNPRLRDRLRPTERASRVYGWFATSVMLFVRNETRAHCLPRGGVSPHGLLASDAIFKKYAPAVA